MKLAIIGAGISGLSLGCFLKAKSFPEKQIFIFDSSFRSGGVIGTTQEKGFQVENAASLFPYRQPACYQLCQILGLQNKVIFPQTEKKYIYYQGKFNNISLNFFHIITNNFLSWNAKISFLKNFFHFQNKNSKKENLEEFFTRQFDNEIFQKIVEPTLAGIYAGDPQKLSLEACFPLLNKLDERYNSLMRGLVFMKKKKPKLASFPNGMQQLIDGMTEYLKKNITLKTKLEKISFQDKKVLCYFRQSNSKLKKIFFDKVILSTPAYSSAKFLQDHSISIELKKITYNSLVICALGYSKKKITVPSGLGFLLPKITSKKLLGGFFTSNIFPFRSPRGSFFIQLMLGGERDKKIVEMSDSEILKEAKKKMKKLFFINAPFHYSKIIRWKKAIPQYSMKHLSILEKLRELEKKHPIYFHSNAYNGVGLADCIKNSCKVAENILALLKK